MSRKWCYLIFSMGVIVLLVLPACNLPLGAQQYQIATGVAQTISAQSTGGQTIPPLPTVPPPAQPHSQPCPALHRLPLP